jgi:hypothetical protein
LDGRWRSERAEPLPANAAGDVNYLVREFHFAGERWRIDFTIYDDAELQRPLLSGRNEGRFEIGAGTDAGAGAEFFFETRTLTPRAPALAIALSQSGCGAGPWTVDRPQSVIERGCPAFRVFSRAECDREYDRVLVQGERLFLGARPADGFMCAPDRRPSAAGDAPLLRQ